jgi:serine protease
MLVLSLAVALGVLPLKYYTPSGPVPLQEAKQALAYQTQHPEKVRDLLKGFSRATHTHLFNNLYLIEQIKVTPQLRGLLRTQGGVETVLATYTQPSGQLFISDGGVLAQFDTRLSYAEIVSKATEAGATEVRIQRKEDGVYWLKARSPQEALPLATQLHESHTALWAHPDFIYKKNRNEAPNDPMFEDQWHHALIGSTAAWEFVPENASAIIAIIDSGVDTTHPDLAAQLISPRDTIGQDNDPNPDGDDAHGTATAGIAAATTYNNLGVAGVCPQCFIMPVRIMSESGWGRFNADSDAFYWAKDHGADVLSNSWGPAGASSIPFNLEQAIRSVADGARNGKGAVILFASGNDGRENESRELASHPMVLSIGATNHRDLRESYSNYGNDLDVVAPSASVTTDIQGARGYGRNDYMYTFGGTSAACPTAAGLAGLIFSVRPDFTRGQVQSIITSTADKIAGTTYNDNGFSRMTGYGRINALRALQMATGGEVCNPKPEDCSNGSDDDCDALIDNADPGCAPATTEVGAACNQDFACGTNGSCLPSDYFPEGYCTTSCTTSSACPGDGVCVSQGRRGAWCLDGCMQRSDCRAGYDCLSVDDGKACVPSCTTAGCSTGETCNTSTGECEHNGASAVGGACSSNVDCSSNGWCLTQETVGQRMPGGYCVTQCRADTDCTGGSVCHNMGRFSLCLGGCQRNSDCREGYACNPNEDRSAGVCWTACASNADCENEVCNEYGLCGSALPPKMDFTSEKPSEANTSTSTLTDDCACDTTYGCEAACACQPSAECSSGKKKGCASIESSWWLCASLCMYVFYRGKLNRLLNTRP